MDPRFSLAMGRIAEVGDVRLRLSREQHPYEHRNASAIDGNWHREIAANRHLFDGRIMVFSRLVTTSGRFEGVAHEARFATFMHWRAQEEKQDLRHAYANAMPVTTDGALLAIEMAPHTVSAGKVYFPSGSFEPEDVRGQEIDVIGNMCREVAEETGLEIASLPRESGFRVLSLGTGTCIATRFLLPFSAAEVEERVRAHMAAEDQPEIARAVLIRQPSLDGLAVAGHMPPLVAWHFANPLDSGRLVT